MSLAAAALLLPALTAAVPSLGDRLVAGYAKQWSLPLTVSKATEAGWTAATGDPTACDVVSGRQFRFGELLTPTLIFDAMGSLAGVQIVVNETTYPSYPQSNWRPSGWWFTATGDPPELSSLALHFKDPAKLCSAEAVDEAGSSIGDRLWLRLTSDDFEQLPLIEEEVQAGMPDSGWNLGRCLPSNVFYPGSLGMGLHYWRHVGRTTASACEDAGPVFLMYEHGVLVGFGILLFGTGRAATVGGVLPSFSPSGAPIAPGDSAFEFPRSAAFLERAFLIPGTAPTCMADLTKWDGTTAGAANLSFIASTMHFALSDMSAITCAPAPPRSPSAPSPPPPLTAHECAGGFIAARLNLRKFELYDTWFDDNSSMTLVQAGVYQGVDDIKEYMKFILPFSPYISANGLLHHESSVVNFDEEKRSCVFLALAHSRFQMSDMGGNELFETAWFNTVEWRFDDQKVGRIDVFCTLPSFCGPRPTAQPRATERKLL
jgi:hypothetical protein